MKAFLRSDAALYGLFLILVTGLGNFAEIGRFTLYSDDWSYLGGTFNSPERFVDFWYAIVPNADGRPLQLGLIELTGEIIWLTQSLIPAYLFLGLLTVLSVLVLWRVLLVRFPNQVAVTAAAIYAISPLVSVRPFLNGIASPFAAIAVLLASLLLVRGRWLAAYLVSVLALASYELMFPLFVLLPVVLRPLRGWRELVRLAVHVLICAALLGVYAVLKDRYGAERLSGVMAGQDKLSLLLDLLDSAMVSMGQAVYLHADLPLWAARMGAGSVMAVSVVLAFAGFALALHRMGPAPTRRVTAEDWQTIALLLLATLTAYFLAWFGPEHGRIAIFGRVSRFHSAACLPLSILVAIALAGVLRAARPGWQRAALVSLEAAYLALMFGLSVSHQESFAAQTERQRRLVAKLVEDHPLLDPEATFAVEQSDASWKTVPSIEYGDGHSYYPLLACLFDVPRRNETQAGPVIRLVFPYIWPQGLRWGDDGKIYWPPGVWPSLPERAGHVWFYNYPQGGVPEAVPGPVLVDGHDIVHEGPDATDGMIDLRKVAKRPLYYILLGGSDAPPAGGER